MDKMLHEITGVKLDKNKTLFFKYLGKKTKRKEMPLTNFFNLLKENSLEINSFLNSRRITFTLEMDDVLNLYNEEILDILKNTSYFLNNLVRLKLKDNLYLLVSDHSKQTLNIDITNSDDSLLLNEAHSFKSKYLSQSTPIIYSIDYTSFKGKDIQFISSYLDKHIYILYNNLLFIGKDEGNFNFCKNNFAFDSKEFVSFILPQDEDYVKSRNNVYLKSGIDNLFLYLTAFLNIDINNIPFNNHIINIRKEGEKYFIENFLLIENNKVYLNYQPGLSNNHDLDFFYKLLNLSDDIIKDDFKRIILDPIKKMH